MYDEVHSVPEVQTEETVRAFSGTLRRIVGGDDAFSVEPFTASTTKAAATLVDEHLFIVPYENPTTPFSELTADKTNNAINLMSQLDFGDRSGWSGGRVVYLFAMALPL